MRAALAYFGIRVRAAIALGGVAVLVIGALVGCGAGVGAVPDQSAGPQTVPSDLAIGVTVFSPETDPARIQFLERWARPARYIVEPDGVLRAATGPGVTTRVFPPRLRELNPAQMSRLWRLAREVGLTRDGHPDAIVSADTFEPSYRETEAVISVIARGELRVAAIALDSTTPEASAARALVDRLAELSWIRR